MNKWVFGIILILCITCLWVFQNAITVNIPWWDDFHGIILPVHDLFTNLPVYDKFQSFISLNNEHRVVNDRIFTLLVFIFTGKFELKTLALLGLLNLIVLFYLLYKILKKEKVSYVAILPVLFLIFHAQYFESLQSLMVPFQNFSVILYMAVSLYFLIFRNKFYWAFIFAFLAIYTHGNGILVFILGGLILVLNQKYKPALLWTLVSIITVVTYFIGYRKPQWTDTDVLSPLENPIASFRYVFEFLGSYALNVVELSTQLNNSYWLQILPQIVGVILTFILGFILFKKYPVATYKDSISRLRNNKSDQFFLAFAAFFLATGIIMGLTRTGFTIFSRYTINSSMYILAIYGFYIINYRNNFSKIISGVTFVGVLLSYYNAIDTGLYRKSNAECDAINYQKNKTWANQYSDSSHVSRVNPLLIEPLKSGEYVFPTNELDNFNDWPFEVKRENLDFSIVDNYLIISGDSNDKEIYFTLESDKNQFIFPVYKIRSNPKEFILKRKYYSNLYQAIFPINIIAKADYQIYKIEKENAEFKKYKLLRTLDSNRLLR